MEEPDEELRVQALKADRIMHVRAKCLRLSVAYSAAPSGILDCVCILLASHNVCALIVEIRASDLTSFSFQFLSAP